MNDDRCSYYPDNSYPLWESSFSGENQFCIDMLEDGSLMAAGKGDSAKVFLPSSNISVWKHNFSGDIQGIALSPDGSTVYVSEELSSSNKVYSFDIGSNTMNWELSFADDYYKNGLVLSGNGNYLLFYQYQNIFILNPDNGSEIDIISNYGETITAISNNGEIIAVGDYTGNAQVYEFNSGSNSYIQIWSFHETGGVYSPWITSVSVSSDGNTVALGSLIYEDPNNDIYNGKLHLFNTYSGSSIWSFEN
ncbi:MAG: hypothetical protein GQ527_06195, partial [Bacteroidales bacterium]|nr:hypothetical protein [Bacteroidales bacterium]